MIKAEALTERVIEALEDLKALDIKTLDVRDISSITDIMIVASGNSDRQVRALARAVAEKAKAAGNPALGVEGEESGEWVLVDLGDVVAHIMQPRIREFYQLEKLWETPPEQSEPAE